MQCIGLIILIVTLPVFLSGQSGNENVKGRLVNAVSSEPIAYVLVYLKSLNKGTVSNLYLDVNTFNDSIHYLLKAVYDPFKSYFHYPDLKRGDAFMSMYFDLFEIEKRHLEMDLLNLNTVSPFVLKSTYHASLENVLRKSRQYVKEVERSKGELAFKRWIAVVEENLKVDNLRFYQLE